MFCFCFCLLYIILSRLYIRIYQSLCAEMASELRFAIRCGSRQRSTFKTSRTLASRSAAPCSSCSSQRSTLRNRASYYSSSTRHQHTNATETTYVPSIEVSRLNGVSLVLHINIALPPQCLSDKCLYKLNSTLKLPHSSRSPLLSLIQPVYTPVSPIYLRFSEYKVFLLLFLYIILFFIYDKCALLLLLLDAMRIYIYI